MEADRIAGFVAQQMERGCGSLHLMVIGTRRDAKIFHPDQHLTAIQIAGQILQSMSNYVEVHGRSKFEIRAYALDKSFGGAMASDWHPAPRSWPPGTSTETSASAKDLPDPASGAGPSAGPIARVVRVFSADEDPAPEVSIVVSGKFPRASPDNPAWSRKHVERFDSDARALENALVTALPGGTLHQLTHLLLSRMASQLVVRDFSAPPVPSPAAPPTQAPVPMLLHCPECGERHVDDGEFATKLHHTHACQSCGMAWRPAIVPTIGVKFLPGFKGEAPGLGDEEGEIDAMSDDGRLGALAKRLAIESGVDWPSLDKEAQDAWHERAIEHVRNGAE